MADREKVIKGLEVCAPNACYAYGQLMRDALALLKEQEPAQVIQREVNAHNNGWISVKDRLPENKKNVLVCLYDSRRKKVSNYPDGKRITIRIDRIVSDYGEPFWAKGNTPNVIAWMPLPEPPKEDEK